MEKGYLALVLHTHLPYVRHPEHDNFLEERWLYEAITETYIPLINIFDGFLKDGIDFKITMSLTPPLIGMLCDPLLQSRYLRYLEKLIELSYKEIERTRWQPEFNGTAHFYRDRFENSRYVFSEKYHSNLINAFRKFQDAGNLEVITCGATHGFLPNMQINANAVRAQIRIAAQYHRQILGRSPAGIWLPECGFFPGVDNFLKEEGIRYFLMDTHGVLFASPRPRYGVYAPIYCHSGVAAFGRDVESSKSVWSAEQGYPGDHRYRDFYRDIGYDLDFDYIRPYIHDGHIRIATGIKYFQITGKSNDKQPYNRHIALETAASHAGNFMFNREKQIEHLAGLMDRKPIIVAPYDAELFGHWWFEGPEWINFLVRKITFDQKLIALTTPYRYLTEYNRNQVSTPIFSSWGYKGFSEVWLEGSNDWIYRHLHEAADRMVQLAQQYQQGTDPLKGRALNQMVRELLLAQSSDWAFIMKTGTMVDYAVRRTKIHIHHFNRLYEGIVHNHMDEGFLSYLEYCNNIFPNLDYRVYA